MGGDDHDQWSGSVVFGVHALPPHPFHFFHRHASNRVLGFYRKDIDLDATE